MDEVITSRLNKKNIDLIDRFVDLGYFSSRSEAIRSILSEGLKELFNRELKKGISNDLETKPKLSNEELIKQGTKLFNRSVADIIAEGRER